MCKEYEAYKDAGPFYEYINNESPLGGLGATKPTMFILGSLESAYSGLPIVNWTFLLGATAEALRANINWKSAITLQRGQFDPKFQVEGVIHTNRSLLRKLG